MTKSFPWQKAAAIAGVAGFALLILPSLLGGKKDGEGSESGGFQLPSIFPAGSGAGEAAPTGSNTYNISFPSFPGFPTGETKKSGYIGGSAEVDRVVRGTSSIPTPSQVSPVYMNAVPKNPAALTKKTSGSKSTGGMGTVTVTQPGTKKTVSVPQKSFNLKYIGKR